MPELIDIEDPSAQPEEPIRISNLPEGMRETTIGERAASVGGRLVGGLGGLTEATAEAAYDAATFPLRAVGIMDFEETKGYEEAYQESSKLAEERLDKDFVDNLTTNLSELLEGFVTIIKSPFDVAEYTEEGKTFIDVVQDETKKAYSATEDLQEVVYGDMAALMNPVDMWDNLQTRPVDLALTMLPVASAVKRLGKAAVIKTASTGGKLSPAAKNMIKAAEKIEAKLMEPVNWIKKKSTYSAIDRWINDPSAQTTPELQDVARRFLNEPQEARARFASVIEDAANKIMEEGLVAAPYTKAATVKRPVKLINEEGIIESQTIKETQAAVVEEVATVMVESETPINLEAGRRLTESVKGTFLDTGPNRIINDPAIMLDNIADIFDDAPAGSTFIANEIESALSVTLARIMALPEGIKAVRTHLTGLNVPENAINSIIADLKNHNVINQYRDTPVMPDYALPNGQNINIIDVLKEASITDNVIKREIGASLIEVLGAEIAPRIEAQSLKYIVDDVMSDVFSNQKPSAERQWQPGTRTTDVLSELIKESELPSLYNVASPGAKNLFDVTRKYLATNLDSIADVIKGQAPVAFQQDLKRILASMEDMVPVGKEAAELLGYRSGEVMIPKSLQDTLKWHSKAANNLYGDSWLQRMNRAIKRNLVVLNPSSHVNNIISNMFMQTLRRASPVAFKDMVVMTTNYIKYVKGNIAGLSSMDIRIFENIRKTNLIDSSFVDVDLALAHGVKGGELIGKAGKRMGVTAINKALEKGYKIGDTIFKVEEFADSFMKLDKALKVLAVGEDIVLMPRKGKKVKLRKTEQGWDIDNKPASLDQVEKLMREAASQQAKNLFFDYSDIPNYVKMLQSLPTMGLISPFYIWFWKSMDIPGFKKGLLGETLTSSSAPWQSTTSPKLNAMAAGGDAWLATKRAHVITGLKSSLPKDQDFKEILDWLPKDMGVHLLDMTLDPGYARTRNIKYMNPYEGTVQLLDGFAGLFKLGIDAIANTHSPVALHMDQTVKEIKADPSLSTSEKKEIIQTRSWWHRWHSGKAEDAATAMNLAGLAGSFFLDIYKEVEGTEEQGKTIDPKKLGSKLASMMFGGVYKKIGSLAFGRDEPLQPGMDKESILRWVVRTTTGQLLKNRNIWKNMDWFMKGLEREYKANVIGPLEKDIEAAVKRGEMEEVKRLSEELGLFAAAIGEELATIGKTYAEQIQALKQKDIK